MPKAVLVGLGFAILAGCATGSVAPERIQATEAAVHEADSSGASNLAAASPYLQSAHGELDQGKQLSSDEQRHQAEVALQHADVDAKLANMLAQKQRLDSENKELGERLKAMQ
jgi:hypothetical protein